MNERQYGEITFPPGVQFNKATPDDFKVNCADENRDSCCGSLHLKRKVHKANIYINQFSYMARRL